MYVRYHVLVLLSNKKVASLSKPCAMQQQKPATRYVVRAQKYCRTIPAMRPCPIYEINECETGGGLTYS